MKSECDIDGCNPWHMHNMHKMNECKPQCCEPKMGSECEKTEMLFRLANKAWDELMREKMKKEWEKSMGPHMDKMAKVATEAAGKYWQNKMEAKENVHMFMNKVHEAHKK